jgi:membrane protein YqaA with SNARE-associated domain
MLRSIYDWVMRLAGHRHAQWYLALVSFIESSIFPIPPDAMLVPMTLARPERAWR